MYNLGDGLDTQFNGKTEIERKRESVCVNRRENKSEKRKANSCGHFERNRYKHHNNVVHKVKQLI